MEQAAHTPSSPTKDLQEASRVLHIQARVMGLLALRDTPWPCRVACSMVNRWHTDSRVQVVMDSRGSSLITVSRGRALTRGSNSHRTLTLPSNLPLTGRVAIHTHSPTCHSSPKGLWEHPHKGHPNPNRPTLSLLHNSLLSPRTLSSRHPKPSLLRREPRKLLQHHKPSLTTLTAKEPNNHRHSRPRKHLRQPLSSLQCRGSHPHTPRILRSSSLLISVFLHLLRRFPRNPSAHSPVLLPPVSLWPPLRALLRTCRDDPPVYLIFQALLMTCPLVQKVHSVLALVHLECLAVRVSKATQHSLHFPLTRPLIYQASVALHPLLSAHLLVPQHPALDPFLQQPCQAPRCLLGPLVVSLMVFCTPE